MRFGETLGKQKYGPWKSNYLDYGKLKKLLRENDSSDSKSREWTDDDESKFVEELVNAQLDKVNDFHQQTYNALRERTSGCEGILQRFESGETGAGEFPESGGKRNKMASDDEDLQEVLRELDSITEEINELFKYSRLNYTGFLKIAKKHDRKRGSRYKVRPLLQVRLAALPFNSEDYSPLLYRCVASRSLHHRHRSELEITHIRLSTMYSFARQRKNGETDKTMSLAGSKSEKDTFTSHKCLPVPVVTCLFVTDYNCSLGAS